MKQVYIPKDGDISSIELFAKRLGNGHIEINSGETLEDFPENIQIGNTIYTLEYIKKNLDEKEKVINNIEWGIYV